MFNSSTVRSITLSAVIIILLSFSQRQYHHILIGVDAIKLTSLGSSINGSSASRGKRKAENKNEEQHINYSSLVCSSSIATCSTTTTTSTSSSYGVDRSFPIHHHSFFIDNESGGAVEHWMTNKQQLYDEYMEGCRQAYHPERYRCDVSEEERIEMNLRQPASVFVSCAWHENEMHCIAHWMIEDGICHLIMFRERNCSFSSCKFLRDILHAKWILYCVELHNSRIS